MFVTIVQIGRLFREKVAEKVSLRVTHSGGARGAGLTGAVALAALGAWEVRGGDGGRTID